MDRIIPFHPCCRLGFGLDVTKTHWECGIKQIVGTIEPVIAQPNFTTAQFSFVESMKDVCDILGIPPEYALKVKANIVQNDVVKECLQFINAKNVTTVVFRTTFLQKKIYLPHDATLITGSKNENISLKSEDIAKIEDINIDTKPKEAHSLETMVKDFDSGLMDDAPLDTSNPSGRGTHCVSAVEIGNELIAIVRIASENIENFDKFSLDLKEALGHYRGILDEQTFSSLEKYAAKADKKLGKSHYKDVHCQIQYGCFSDQDHYPDNLSGMVKMFQEFEEKSIGWKDLSNTMTPVQSRPLMIKESIHQEKKGFFKRAIGMLVGQSIDSAEAASNAIVGAYHTSGVDGDEHDHESFVVLASETDAMFNMRVTLQSDHPEDGEIESFTSFALSQYPETSRKRFENLFHILQQVDKAVTNLQVFFQSKRFMSENRVKEGNQLLQSVQNIHFQVNEAIRNLDMITMPSEEFVENLWTANPLQTVEDYIENVMSKLPPGCDLDLLVIGKTGHGKSSTGNSILGQQKFVASASGESVTKTTSVAWSNVDGRIIKVVDTPGVCDTAEDTNTNSIDQAIGAISEAITHCSMGFHALLLVIRFGQRMTMEEKKAIGMLKCILGENIIESHCICVITHGDNFEAEFEGNMSFQDWCRKREGFLKEIFKECQYRCVLFNNKTKDPKVAKSQIIELVNKIDSFGAKGTRYTNALFQFAESQREKKITEENIPQVSQEMMRDIELVLDHLQRMSDNTAQKEKYSSELVNLKGMVENLSNRVTQVEGDQVKLLVETVFSLAEVIHGEIGKVAERESADPPDNVCRGAEGCVDSHHNPVNFDSQRQNLENFRDIQREQAKPVDKEVKEVVEVKIKEEKQCFPGSSKVKLRNGTEKKLEDLEVGEEVLVRNDKGQSCFDTVYMFGHRDDDTVVDFIGLHVQGESVFVSHDHLVFCIRNGSEMSLLARNVKIDDHLIMMSSDLTRNFKPVIHISREKKRGLFAPFTNCGTIVIDGALMSCYVGVLPHARCHALLSPIRQLYRFSPSTLAYVNGGLKNKGVPVWAKMTLKWL